MMQTETDGLSGLPASLTELIAAVRLVRETIARAAQPHSANCSAPKADRCSCGVYTAQNDLVNAECPESCRWAAPRTTPTYNEASVFRCRCLEEGKGPDYCPLHAV